jgi:hypothetical protein
LVKARLHPKPTKRPPVALKDRLSADEKKIEPFDS